MRLTLDESKNMETDRATSQDTLEGMYDPKVSISMRTH